MSSTIEENNRGLVQLVCSPIGNLGDITYRAVESLKRADLIVCEDTRHSRRLLSHYEINGSELWALHEHNESKKAAEVVERALAGQRVAVLSDAGTPTISDPGFRLVNHCIPAGVRVEVLPGACAITCGLAGSGMPTDAFYFGGFLPVKSGKRERILSEALVRIETSVFFESPHRVLKSLKVLAELDPEREVCVARELTKKFETYHRGSSKELLDSLSPGPVKGEITLLIRGAGKRKKAGRNRLQE